ncbi:MAG: UvrD-helicase domain-containing protein [Candidatus Cloacimonetes bacterium]|nr:UvrD-helicase domain-containing protein [Candidatus Cloacimonadota bacterium]
MSSILIRASAGTGKTYRLSLEYINLLLQYRVDFEEILVITFTKKATAEIRERIFKQLKEIVTDSPHGKEIKANIQTKINPKLKFNSEEIKYLKSVYQKMLTSKSTVRINTIDSFVNTIFQGIIAPFHNITDYRIDDTINVEILPEIYESILKKDKLDSYKNIFLQAKNRNLQNFQNLLNNIIENRWFFDFIDLSVFKKIDLEAEKSKTFKEYQSELKEFLNLLQSEIIAKTVKTDKKVELLTLLQKGFQETISSYLDFSKLTPAKVVDEFFALFSNEDFIDDNFKQILEDKNLWNGRRLANKELKDKYENLKKSLANYLYYAKAFMEQINIMLLASEVLLTYDEIKFRDRIFTHSDISYYTYKYLYDSNFSIVDKDNVLNLFYEQLSFSTRFVLIDEFQDTSILQWKIIFPMLKEITSGIGQKDYGMVIVVGDEKQAIYGWRGGERRLLNDFKKIFSNSVKCDSLTTSYRSKPILMNFLNRVFGAEPLKDIGYWDYSEIISDKKEGGFVQVDFRNATEEDERVKKVDIYRDFVCNKMQVLLTENKINPADTAIIMRKNDELYKMSVALDEAGIDYTLESSGSLFDHPAIKPVLFILKFLVYEDFLELIKFLRSDLVLMDTADLQTVIANYHESANLDDFLQQDDLHPYLKILFKLKYNNDSLLYLIKLILEEFGFKQVFGTDIELKNLQRFLEVAAAFESSDLEFTKDVEGFLHYCRSLSDKEEYSRIGQTISDSIKLLTIHKSKGLQFETVFTVFDVTGAKGGNNFGLNLYHQFKADFSSLDDFAFSLNYDKVLQKSGKKELIDKVKIRKDGEELNNLYVALTRAKNNLFCFLHYNKKGDLEKFICNLKVSPSVLKSFAKTIYLGFQDDLIETASTMHQIQFGEISTDSEQIAKQINKTDELPDFFQIYSREKCLENKKTEIKHLCYEFLDKKSILIGNIVHEYLSLIKYNEEAEREYARGRTIGKYGSLLPQIKIEEIIQKANSFIDDHPVVFSEIHWDKVFNEFEIFDDYGKTYRIDRLMISSRNKLIKIIDYKTGAVQEAEQLSRYKNIIKKLPMVGKENYEVESEYIKV